MNYLFKHIDFRNKETIFKLCIIGFLFLYVFSVAAFSEPNFSKLSFLNYGIYLIYVSMIALFAITVIHLVLFKDPIKINRFALVIPMFVLYALIGTIAFSKDFRGWATLVLLCGSFFIFIYSFRITNNKKIVLMAISIALCCFGLFYLIYYGSTIFEFKEFFSGRIRLGKDFDNQNGVASIAVLSFGISLYLVLSLKNKIRFVFIIPVIISTWVGITTGSRTFLIATYLIIAILFGFFFKKHLLIYIIALVAITVVSLLIFNSIFENRLLNAFLTLFGESMKADPATISRELYMDYGLILGSRNALIGYGVNGFGIFSGVGTYAHNNYAEILCDFGIIGTILFYLPLFIFVFRTLKYKKIDKMFVITFIVYYFVASFSNVLYYKKMYYLILALLFFLTYEEPFERRLEKSITNLNRIVFACDTMGSGGAERVIAVLSNQLISKNIDVFIVGVSDRESKGSFYQLNERVKYIVLQKDSDKKIRALKRALMLRKTIKEINPDIVISFLPHVNVYTYFALIGTKIPYIVSERNNPYKDPKDRILRILKRVSFNMANGCVFQTNESMNYYGEKVKEKSTIIQNPLSLNFAPQSNFAKRNNTVLAVGRFVEQKNYHLLLEAFKEFNERKNYSYILRIYGDGVLKNELIDYCENLGISNKVIFAGSDNNWQEKEYMDAMYILTSDYEGMPNSLIEAMAIGIPCISTDCPSGGPRELIRDGENGYLVEVGNKDMLVEKMISISNTNPQFGEANKNMINDLSPSKITDEWISYIMGLEKVVYE